MVESLTIIVKKRYQAAIKRYLQEKGLEGWWLETGGERLAFLPYNIKSERQLAEVVLALIWLEEERRLLSWAEESLFTIDSRWERKKWQQRVRKRCMMESTLLFRAVRRDLRALNWQKPVLDIAGFTAFAARSLRRQMAALGREEWLSYQEEKERREFAAVLQSFVQMQEPVVAVANVFWARGAFEIRDEKGCDLQKIYETSLLLEQVEDPGDITGEDLLLSILITVVPAQLVIHGAQKQLEKTLEMVAMVFDDRLTWCSGCVLCQGKNFERH